MKEIELFLRVIEAEEFVEGHEVLEELWKEWKHDALKKEESYILKGLINGSTALALVHLGRLEGAKRVWGTFEKYTPLIESISSPHIPLYKTARDLLKTKYGLYGKEA